MTTPSDGPFDAGGTQEVPLANAPLVRVLCQVSWAEQTLLTTSFAKIADEVAIVLASEYPTRATQQTISLEIDPASGLPRPATVPPNRQLISADEVWAVHFTPVFVTLENRGAYTSRDDMIARLERVLEAVQRSAQLTSANRIGWRYLNRISDPATYEELPRLVHDSVRGAGAIPVSGSIELLHSMSDSLFNGPSGKLGAKWGFLPPNSTHDPNMPPIDLKCWVLDLDAFRDTRTPFEVAELIAQVRELSSMAYDFFRWAVKDPFIERFGGHRDSHR